MISPGGPGQSGDRKDSPPRTRTGEGTLSGPLVASGRPITWVGLTRFATGRAPNMISPGGTHTVRGPVVLPPEGSLVDRLASGVEPQRLWGRLTRFATRQGPTRIPRGGPTVKAVQSTRRVWTGDHVGRADPLRYGSSAQHDFPRGDPTRYSPGGTQHDIPQGGPTVKDAVQSTRRVGWGDPSRGSTSWRSRRAIRSPQEGPTVRDAVRSTCSVWTG
jgi:hypothetical protein